MIQDSTTERAFVYRQQFPITTSYAVTMHKCQGLSLKTVLMDISQGGQSYVALSRITSSLGFHLINFQSQRGESSKRLRSNTTAYALNIDVTSLLPIVPGTILP
ncbi:hypothetical protein M8J76_001092 [Diaphorina citri]|nr:hypothetical protein M8J76_001092 [Diaphorina citri]